MPVIASRGKLKVVDRNSEKAITSLFCTGSIDALPYRFSPLGIHLHHISSAGSWIPSVFFLLQAVPQFVHCAAISAECLLVRLVATGSPGIASAPGPAISAFQTPQHWDGLTEPSWPGPREKRKNVCFKKCFFKKQTLSGKENVHTTKQNSKTCRKIGEHISYGLGTSQG